MTTNTKGYGTVPSTTEILERANRTACQIGRYNLAMMATENNWAYDMPRNLYNATLIAAESGEMSVLDVAESFIYFTLNADLQPELIADEMLKFMDSRPAYDSVSRQRHEWECLINQTACRVAYETLDELAEVNDWARDMPWQLYDATLLAAEEGTMTVSGVASMLSAYTPDSDDAEIAIALLDQMDEQKPIRHLHILPECSDRTSRMLNRELARELDECSDGLGFEGAGFLFFEFDENGECMYQIVADGDIYECEGGDAEEVASLIAAGLGTMNTGATDAFRQAIAKYRMRVRDALLRIRNGSWVTPVEEIMFAS